MLKRFALAALLVGLTVTPLSLRAAPLQSAPACLHGPSEGPAQRNRREQALALAQQINRAEAGEPLAIPAPGRTYRPFRQLRNLPPTPDGFRLQFYIDGPTYSFSLTDTRDSCRYAIFSNQDQGIYDGMPRSGGARIIPADVP